MKVLWFVISEYQHCYGQELPDRTEHLTNDKLPFRFIEIMCGNFEVELEKNDESISARRG
jgi:hypothetical protein